MSAVQCLQFEFLSNHDFHDPQIWHYFLLLKTKGFKQNEKKKTSVLTTYRMSNISFNKIDSCFTLKFAWLFLLIQNQKLKIISRKKSQIKKLSRKMSRALRMYSKVNKGVEIRSVHSTFQPCITNIKMI